MKSGVDVMSAPSSFADVAVQRENSWGTSYRSAAILALQTLRYTDVAPEHITDTPRTHGHREVGLHRTDAILTFSSRYLCLEMQEI